MRTQHYQLDAASITHAKGLGWRFPLPQEFAQIDPPLPGQEKALIMENGKELGPYQLFDEPVFKTGRGLYTVRDGAIFFSTSDNSDPRTNGRTYTIGSSKEAAIKTMTYPRSVAIETLNTCNARCIFCPLFQGEHQMDRKKRPAYIMPLEVFEKAIAEIASWPQRPDFLYLNMDGEPLQDPHFIDRARIVERHGLGPVLQLQSNGQLMDEAKAHAILDADTSCITFGFDGATKETYEAHRVRCTYETVLANIKMFARLRDAEFSNTKIQIKFVRTRKNAHEVRAAHALFSTFLNKELDTFEDMLALDWSSAATSSPEDLYYIPRLAYETPIQGCAAARTQLVVHSDGTLSACCFDYNLDVVENGLGNIAPNGLLAAWQDSRRSDLCARLESGNLEEMPVKCRTCPALYGFDVPEVQPAAVPEACVTHNKWGFTYRFL